MSIALTLDIRTPQGNMLPEGARVMINYDRDVRYPDGSFVPATLKEPVTITAGVDPIVPILYANDDPAIATESQGFALVITARWRYGVDTGSMIETRAIDSSYGSAVNFSKLPPVTPISADSVDVGTGVPTATPPGAGTYTVSDSGILYLDEATGDLYAWE